MRERFHAWRSVLVLVSLLGLLLIGCAPSQENPGTSFNSGDTAASAFDAGSAPAPVSNGSPGEAIKVHGHWTIEVRNPDGTIAEVRDFENALLGGTGAETLAKVLGRQYSVGGLTIQLYADAPGNCPFRLDGGQHGYIVESAYPSSETYFFKNLVLNVPAAPDPNANKLVLSGTATAIRAGNISQVDTAVKRLDPSSPPSGTYPAPGAGHALTRTTLASMVNLSAGQQVAVTVVISFS